ncbi:unnamed protein product [Ilex paraguariensis]|uniref:Uncharacterized protein n=1 Tax=Ilex paraguariensis TaxID=185542 RepID=A0ABC8R1A8_9AQUA
METPQYGFLLIFSLVTTLGLISCSFCIAAEFKRSKEDSLRINGTLCYLPGSTAFGFGVAALIFLFIAQIIGNVIVCKNFCSGRRRSSCKAEKPSIASIFLVLSWISFGVATILIGAATSMTRRQPLGEGWLDGECYIVKDGVYSGSAVLVLITVSSQLISLILITKKSQVEKDQKVHTQVE